MLLATCLLLSVDKIEYIMLDLKYIRRIFEASRQICCVVRLSLITCTSRDWLTCCWHLTRSDADCSQWRVRSLHPRRDYLKQGQLALLKVMRWSMICSRTASVEMLSFFTNFSFTFWKRVLKAVKKKRGGISAKDFCCNVLFKQIQIYKLFQKLSITFTV